MSDETDCLELTPLERARYALEHAEDDLRRATARWRAARDRMAEATRAAECSSHHVTTPRPDGAGG